MSIKIKFDGKFKREFTSVDTSDVVLNGRKLLLQGVIIPIPETYLFSVFDIIEDLSHNKYGTLYITIRTNNCVEYHNGTFKKMGYYTASKLLNLGLTKNFNHLSENHVPSDDTYMIGGDNDAYWDKLHSGYYSSPCRRYGDNDL